MSGTKYDKENFLDLVAIQSKQLHLSTSLATWQEAPRDASRTLDSGIAAGLTKKIVQS